MRKDMERVHIPGVEWNGQNPFVTGFHYGNYSISPIAEACSTLYTKYNIGTDGIVIGENIDSHEYKINGLRANLEFTIERVDAMANVLDDLTRTVNIMAKELESVQHFLS
jgi:hypothetical protein